MITLTLKGLDNDKVNIQKDTYFTHYTETNMLAEITTIIVVVKDCNTREFRVKESFGEVNQLLKGNKI